MIRVGIFIALTIQCVFSSCNVGWTENNGFCYAFSVEALPWLQAASACMLYNARLVQVKSQEKNDFIASQMVAANIDAIWIGGTCRYHSSYYEWIPGARPINYTNWGAGEPNNPESEQCLEIYFGLQYKWNDASCGTAMRFACEKRATSG